ncbi:MAG TPA: hypothetical protein VFV98_04555 [Vicinamibacterales bacterium]|nr:hypothetical protein [Vicinamibacterales bacterium]
MSVAFGIGVIALIVGAGMAWILVAHGGTSTVAAIGGIGLAMAVEWSLAASGVLARWSLRPPPFMMMMAAVFAATMAIALRGPGSRVAAGASFALLIGTQAFRLPLELVMHQAARDGVMPVQMTYTGWNFDIVTGALAIPVALLAAAGRAPRWLITFWNVGGLLLLLNIVTIAIVSTPPIAAFGADHLNTWIADAPYVWLPGVLVPAALFGHVLVLRKLVHRR